MRGKKAKNLRKAVDQVINGLGKDIPYVDYDVTHVKTVRMKTSFMGEEQLIKRFTVTMKKECKRFIYKAFKKKVKGDK